MTTHQEVVDYKNISLFKGLNALRFFAAFLVILHHGETIKRKNGLEHFEWLGLFRNGGNAVTFFFVLSGFLITYLLLKERAKTGNINIRTFYLKRVLRIWPLYFLLVFIGTIGLPFLFQLLSVDYEMPYSLEQTWYYFLFFLPGLVTFYYGHHLLEPLWSIGVEEVFYLFWAPLFKFIKNHILQLLLMVIVLKSVLSLLALFVFQNELFTYLLNLFQFEAMAVGGLGAFFLYSRKQSIDHLFIFKVPVQLLVLLTILLYLCFHTNIDNSIWNAIFKTSVLSPLLINFLYLYLIMSTSVVQKSVLKLRNRVLGFLGEISYGIYMYHMLVIFGTLHFLKTALIQMGAPWNHWVFYGVVILLTLLISVLSKFFFENYFLNLKEKLNKNAQD